MISSISFTEFEVRSQEDAETQSLLKEMTAAKNSLRLADSFLEFDSSLFCFLIYVDRLPLLTNDF